MRKTHGLPLSAFGIFVAAAVVGATGALLGVCFQKTLQWLQVQFTSSQVSSIVEAGRSLPEWRRVLTPALGGLCAALLLWLVRWQRGPFGIGDIVELATLRKGTIKPLTSFVHILSSAFSISSGGSIGKEGPNSQLGATMAALLSRVFHLSTRSSTVLLGAGVAAGMSVAYKAPIAGALFVMEVVLGNFAMDVFAPIVVSSVVASMVWQAFYPWQGIYVTDVVIRDWRLVLSTLLLGALCGFGGIAFRKALELGRSVFAKVPPLLSLPLGGALVGLIGVWYPEVWGNGLDAIEIIAKHEPTAAFVAVLLLLKILATAISTGSGGLGGIFTPNLVVGAAFGYFFGEAVHFLAPGTPESSAAFAYIGLAGLCAATTHAPITAVLLIFEMTRDYNLALPLMLCSIVASVTARMLDQDSIYTARLRAKGHDMAGGLEQLAMQSNYVRDIMRRDIDKVGETTTFETVMEMFGRSRKNAVYVVDGAQLLTGQIHIHDVKNFMNDPSLDSVVIAQDLARKPAVATPDESLAALVPRFDDPELDELPVVASREHPLLVGRVTRGDVVARLSSEVLGRKTMRARLQTADDKHIGTFELPERSEMFRFEIHDALVDRTIESIDFGSKGLIPLLVQSRVVDGEDTQELAMPQVVLKEGAVVVVIGTREGFEAFQREVGE